jgi:MerR family transcriptional regulator/heat shock protein HspR
MKEESYMYIGEAAKKINIHEQTIREYERRGLLKPDRSSRNTRLYTKKDLLRIEIIITLTQEVGLNLSGVNVLLSLARHLGMSDDELLDYITDNITEFIP